MSVSLIKAKYDETNGFGIPVQFEPAPSSFKTDKESDVELNYLNGEGGVLETMSTERSDVSVESWGVI